MKISDLKIIAAISMLIDHCAYVWGCLSAPSGLMNALHMFGRTSYPLFCFCLATGWKKTHDKQAYYTRLMACAALSQIPFSIVFSSLPAAKAGRALERSFMFSCDRPILCAGILCAASIILIFRKSSKSLPAYAAAILTCTLPALRLSWGNICFLSPDLNVIYTFLIALGIIHAVDLITDSKGITASSLLLIAAAASALYFMGKRVDYGLFGIALIIILYYLPDLPLAAGACIALWGVAIYGLHNGNWTNALANILPSIIICLYNGMQGRNDKAFKLFYYIFYPAHLALLGLIFLI